MQEQPYLDSVGPGLQVERSAADRAATGKPSTPAEQNGSSYAPVLGGKPARQFVLVERQTAAPPAVPSFDDQPAHASTQPASQQSSTAPAWSVTREQTPGRTRLRFLRDPRLKRAIDVAGSAALLGVLAPVLGACAAAVRLSSPGPILFRQQRVGREGRPFEMLKFRTMHQNADHAAHQRYVEQLIAGTADAHADGDTPVFKLVGDRRVTPAGRWLRRLSLDELPQLVNVLRGDMSLVGPRPPLPYEVEHYTPRHLERLAATPGITGLWQVSGRSRTTFEEMIDLDLTYIERWSVALDLRILLRTVPVVIFPDGN